MKDLIISMMIKSAAWFCIVMLLFVQLFVCCNNANEVFYDQNNPSFKSKGFLLYYRNTPFTGRVVFSNKSTHEYYRTSFNKGNAIIVEGFYDEKLSMRKEISGIINQPENGIVLREWFPDGNRKSWTFFQRSGYSQINLSPEGLVLDSIVYSFNGFATEEYIFSDSGNIVRKIQYSLSRNGLRLPDYYLFYPNGTLRMRKYANEAFIYSLIAYYPNGKPMIINKITNPSKALLDYWIVYEEDTIMVDFNARFFLENGQEVDCRQYLKDESVPCCYLKKIEN